MTHPYVTEEMLAEARVAGEKCFKETLIEHPEIDGEVTVDVPLPFVQDGKYVYSYLNNKSAHRLTQIWHSDGRLLDEALITATLIVHTTVLKSTPEEKE